MALGWAINGMIGNASGAAIPGAFIAMAVAGILGLTRADPLKKSIPAHELTRLAAFGAIGFWFGGEMTYGQMFGLTRHDIADGTHYWWGILGTVVKGSAWQGVGAACVGLGLMCKKYRWQEIMLLMLAMTAASALGIALINRPLDPSSNLGLISFSYDPVNPDNPPRTEMWAGPWSGLIVLLLYAGAIKKDRVTLRFALFGILGGGLGFAAGQMLQAYSWAHPTIAFRPWIDWWKVMELTFGFVGGCSIALAALLTQRKELPPADWESKPIPSIVEWTGIVLWLLILLDYFSCNPIGNSLAPLPFVAGVIALGGVAAGRWWPWIVVGVQVPAATGLITTTEVMYVYPYDGGWGPNGEELISLWAVLHRAWPTTAISVLVCAVPMAIWLYRQPPSMGSEQQEKTARSIFQLFVGYHVIAVFVQMVWRTMDAAASWSLEDILASAPPFWVLIGVFSVCWIASMFWFSRISVTEPSPNSSSGFQK